MLIDSYIGKGEVIKISGTIGCGDGKGKIKITDRFVYIQEPDDNVFIYDIQKISSMRLVHDSQNSNCIRLVCETYGNYCINFTIANNSEYLEELVLAIKQSMRNTN